MISFLCIVWLLYHIIVEQCQIGYVTYQDYSNKKKQEEYNRLQWEKFRQEETNMQDNSLKHGIEDNLESNKNEMDKEIENKIKECCTFLIEQENGLAFVRNMFYPPVITDDVLDFTYGGGCAYDERHIDDLLDYKYIITKIAEVRPITESTDYFNKHITEYIFNAKSAITGEKATIKGYIADNCKDKAIWNGKFIYKGKCYESDTFIMHDIWYKAAKLRDKKKKSS